MSGDGDQWVTKQHEAMVKAAQVYELPNLTSELAVVRNCFRSLVFTTARAKRSRIRCGKFLVITYRSGYTDNYLYLIALLTDLAYRKQIAESTAKEEQMPNGRMMAAHLLRKLSGTERFVEWYSQPRGKVSREMERRHQS
jgi:hypothetical protein